MSSSDVDVEYSSSQDDEIKRLRTLLENKESKISELEASLSESAEDKSKLVAMELMLEDLNKEGSKAGEEAETYKILLGECQEESSGLKSEYEDRMNKLLQENNDLKFKLKFNSEKNGETVMDKDSLFGSAAALSDVTKSLARRVKSNLQTVVMPGGNALDEEPMNPDMAKAKEDTEILRSIIIPLEEQIEALKTKLRETDALLAQTEEKKASEILKIPSLIEYLNNRPKDSPPFEDSTEFYDAASSVKISLLLSKNKELEESLKAEKKLVEKYKNDHSADKKSEEEENELKIKLENAEKFCKKYKDELSSEAVYRKEVEDKWNEQSECHKGETDFISERIINQQKNLEELKANYDMMFKAVRRDLLRLTSDREKIVGELKRLQKENDSLVGKHLQKSLEFQNQPINLPEGTEDVYSLLLNYREEVISAKIAKEFAEEKLASETAVFNNRFEKLSEEQKRNEATLNSEIRKLKVLNQYTDSYKSELEAETKRRLQLEAKLQEFDIAKAKIQTLEMENQSRASKIQNLQGQLDTSVDVQTDFVKLSQNLQIQLEKLRQETKEVRWQHEDDVDCCSNCKISFNVRVRKNHCLHCGHIFCLKCLSKVIHSGPVRRPMKVCDVCHTLLDPKSVPFFSVESPTKD